MIKKRRILMNLNKFLFVLTISSLVSGCFTTTYRISSNTEIMKISESMTQEQAIKIIQEKTWGWGARSSEDHATFTVTADGIGYQGTNESVDTSYSQMLDKTKVTTTTSHKDFSGSLLFSDVQSVNMLSYIGGHSISLYPDKNPGMFTTHDWIVSGYVNKKDIKQVLAALKILCKNIN